MLVSGLQQSDSVIHTHVSILFQILFPFRLLHNTEQSSLCYTVGPGWLSILFYFFFEFLNFILFIFLYSRFLLVINFIHIGVYMSIPIGQFIPALPHPLPLSPLGVHMFVLFICVSISALQTGSSVPFI